MTCFIYKVDPQQVKPHGDDGHCSCDNWTKVWFPHVSRCQFAWSKLGSSHVNHVLQNKWFPQCKQNIN